MTKRIFDFLLSFILLILLMPFLIVLLLFSAIDTNSYGLFLQERIGRFGKPFVIIKLRTYHKISEEVSSYGRWLRSNKIDEFPQLFNVFIGDMSFVGPRPDISGYFDTLQGENQIILNLRPGITGPATLKYTNEDKILSKQKDRVHYNDSVLFPDKVRINLEYCRNRSFFGDLKIMFRTIQTILMTDANNG